MHWLNQVLKYLTNPPGQNQGQETRVRNRLEPQTQVREKALKQVRTEPEGLNSRYESGLKPVATNLLYRGRERGGFEKPEKGERTYVVFSVYVVDGVLLPSGGGVFVLLRGSLGFVAALLGGDCKAFFFGYVGRCAVPYGVGCEVAVFEVQLCFFGDFAEDVSKRVFVVAVAVHGEPECVPAVVLLPCFPFVEPAF